MLILTRSPNQMLRIGETVTVKVLEVKAGQVRLGISAPDEIRVNREEVHQRILREREADQAAAAVPGAAQ